MVTAASEEGDPVIRACLAGVDRTLLRKNLSPSFAKPVAEHPDRDRLSRTPRHFFGRRGPLHRRRRCGSHCARLGATHPGSEVVAELVVIREMRGSIKQ
jgi:hypothetical protein